MVIVQVLQASEVWSSRVRVGRAVATMVASIDTMRMAKHAVPKMRCRRRPLVRSASGRRTSLVWAHAQARSDLAVCGHTHMQFDRRIGDVRVVNAGSVGMPYAEPGAYRLLLGPGVEFRR